MSIRSGRVEKYHVLSVIENISSNDLLEGSHTILVLLNDLPPYSVQKF